MTPACLRLFFNVLIAPPSYSQSGEDFDRTYIKLMMSFSLKQVATVEDILNGGEGDKFKATADIILHAQKSTDNDGKINSTACSIQ